jgi:putative copper resistance protein D
MDGTEVILVLSRLTHFAAAMLVLGTSMFRLYFRAAFRASDGLDRAFDRWLQPILLLGAVVALVSSAAWLDAEATAMGNGLSDALNLRTLSAVLFETAFGHVWIWHLLSAVILLCALLLLRGTGWNAAAVGLIAGIAAFVVASLAWTGHAVMRSGWTGQVDMAVQTLHVFAASAWLGSLPALGYILYRARFDHGGTWRRLARDILPRYSRVGYLAVGLIMLTGSFASWRLVASVAELAGTTYGHVLLAKICLFGLMVALALVNRFGLSPIAIKSTSTALEMKASFMGLGRNVMLEQLLGLMVLGAVSLLGTLPPALIGSS